MRTGGTKFVRTDDVGGDGYEPAREATVCAECAARVAEIRASVPVRVVAERGDYRRRAS